MSSETPEATAALAHALQLSYPVLGDPDLDVISGWQDADAALGLAWPTMYLISPQGRIAWFAVAEGAHTAPAALRAAARFRRQHPEELGQAATSRDLP